MDPNDTLPPDGPSDSNRGTRIPLGAGPRLAPDALAEAYALARAGMAHEPPVAPGYRLFWVCGREVGWRDLPVGGAYAILGRHTECDAVLRADPAISLRHLLAMTVTLADGVALRLLDLQTAVPFYLEDARPRRSVLVSGPVVVRLGAYVVGAVPIEETGAGLRLQLGPLPRAVVTDAAQASVRVASAPASPHTQVTSIPPPRSVSEVRRPRVAAGSPLTLGTCARLTLSRGAHRAAVDLTETELDLGVLIGRAVRCYDDGLQAVLDNNISRGHVLLLHHYDVIEAFDLCSTQSTFMDERRMRRVTFARGGGVLGLGSVDPVMLELEVGAQEP